MTTIPLIQNDRQRETLTSQFHVDALRAQHECGALCTRLRRGIPFVNGDYKAAFDLLFRTAFGRGTRFDPRVK